MAASALAPRTMPGVLFARGMQRATDTRSAHPMQFHKLVRKVMADGHICMVAENAFSIAGRICAQSNAAHGCITSIVASTTRA